MPILRRVLPALLFVLTLSASAQSYPIDKVVFKGGAPYTDAELLAASGLKPGDVLTRKTLGNPAQNLLNTGLFDDAGMDLVGPGNRTVVLELKPIPDSKLLAASFENFVWWTPEELRTALQEKVPLYRGYCSDAGNFADLVQAALQQMLTAKGIHVTLSHGIVEASTAHPLRIMNFKIEQPEISLLSATLTGTPADAPDASRTASGRLAGISYNEGLAGRTIEDRLLLPWRSLGYIHAQLTAIQRTPSATADGIAVTYTAHLDPGTPYKIGSITWSATPLFSAADFDRTLKLHPGEVANDALLLSEENQIARAYFAQGYLNAYIAQTTTADDANHTVSYALQAIPGDQYRLRNLSVTGLPPEAQQAFNDAWKMKSGDLYDSAYFDGFTSATIATPGLLKGRGATYTVLPDPPTHTVDMTITYYPPAPGR
jgi:hypothetical protein